MRPEALQELRPGSCQAWAPGSSPAPALASTPLTATTSWSFHLDLEAVITWAQSVAKTKAHMCCGLGSLSVHVVTRAHGHRQASFRPHPRASPAQEKAGPDFSLGLLPHCRGRGMQTERAGATCCFMGHHVPSGGGGQVPESLSPGTPRPLGWGRSGARVTVPCRPHSNTRSPIRLNGPPSGLCPPHRAQRPSQYGTSREGR